jgi:hypothetical protein
MLQYSTVQCTWRTFTQKNLIRIQGQSWPDLLEGGGCFPEGVVHYYGGPGTMSTRIFLKFKAVKCNFLHSELYIYSLNLSSVLVYFEQKLRKVLRYNMVTHRIGT